MHTSNVCEWLADPELVVHACVSPAIQIGGEPKMRVKYSGLLDALVQIKAQEGLPGFFRGVYPRLLVHAPSVAVSWTTFEVLKKTLDRWDDN